MYFAIVVTAISLRLVTFLLELGVEGVELGVQVFRVISNNSSKIRVRQCLVTIQYQDRFRSSHQLFDEII